MIFLKVSSHLTDIIDCGKPLRSSFGDKVKKKWKRGNLSDVQKVGKTEI